MKNPVIKPEDIERVLDNGKRLPIPKIALRLGLSHPQYLYKLLPAMRTEGRIQSCREKEYELEGARMVTVYYTSEPPTVVGAPYPAVLMTGQISGYERALRQHAELCMTTRGRV